MAPIAGGVIVMLSALSQQALAVLLALTSGFFLLTATGDLLPDTHRRSSGLTVTAAMIAGLGFMYAVVRLLGAE